MRPGTSPRRALAFTVALACAAGCQPPTGRAGAPGPAGRPATTRPAAGTASPRGSAAPAATPPGGLVPPTPPAAGPAQAGIVTLSGVIRLPAAVLANNGAAIISEQGGGIISEQGGGIISEQGGGLIANNGSSIISRTKYRTAAGAGGYRLAALEQVPVARAGVQLRDAAGQLVVGADGKPLLAFTDDQGRYAFGAALPKQNLVLEVALQKGAIRAIVPRDGAAVDGDMISTLSTAYILEQYVQGRQATFEKLPADVEAETRAKAAAAVEKAAFVPPTDLAATALVPAVDGLRKADAAFDAQLEKVKRLLVAGLADQGAGLDASTIALDIGRLSWAPDGAPTFLQRGTRRAWRISPDNRVVPIAGSGAALGHDHALPGAPTVPGDGGPATAAVLSLADLAYTPAGDLLLLDNGTGRVRKVDAAGTITTFATHPDWTYPKAMAVRPDGALVVATHSAVYEVSKDGQVSLIAGQARPYDYLKVVKIPITGDGGDAKAAVFAEIGSVAIDPRTGDVYVTDYKTRVRKIAGGVVTAVAGYGEATADGEPPLETAFATLRGGQIAFTPAGDLLVLDRGRVRRIGPEAVTTLYGVAGAAGTTDDGPAADGRLGGASAFAVRTDGAIAVSDGDRLRVIADGQVRTLAGRRLVPGEARPADEVQLEDLGSMAYHPQEHALYVASSYYLWRLDLATNAIQAVAGATRPAKPFVDAGPALGPKVTSGGAPLIEADGAVVFTAQVDAPDGRNLSKVLRYTNGIVHALAGEETPLEGNYFNTGGPARTHLKLWPGADVVRQGDQYYFNQRGTGTIRRFALDASHVAFAGAGTSKEPGVRADRFDFKYVTTIRLGPDGKLYAADSGAIYRFGLVDRIVERVVGTGTAGDAGLGGPAAAAQISFTNQMAFDAQGRLHFGDYANNRVVRVNADGTLVAVAGRGSGVMDGATFEDSLPAPTGIAFDREGHLYISLPDAGQIRMVPRERLP